MKQVVSMVEKSSTASNCRQAVVACSDPEIRECLIEVLRELGLQPVSLKTLEEVELRLARNEAALVFSQPSFCKGSFREVLAAADSSGSGIPVVVCSEFYDRDLYVEAMGLGAFDYLAFPYSRDEVAWIVTNALSVRSRSRGGWAAGERSRLKEDA